MLSVRQRAKYYLITVGVLVLVSSVLYDYGMRRFEPEPYPPETVENSLVYSTQFVVETFTATGYGSHSPWFSPEMQTFVMVLDVTGVAIFFLALPAIFIPLFRDALSGSVPRQVDEEVKDHVVICTYTQRAEALIEELEAKEVGYVLVEPDRDVAVKLQEEGSEVVHADPESVSGLESVNISKARALVADVADQVDASIVLAAREVSEEVKIVSVVEDTELTDYHRLAGADIVLRPREQLGKSLAAKMTTGVSAEGDGIRIGDDFEIVRDSGSPRQRPGWRDAFGEPHPRKVRRERHRRVVQGRLPHATASGRYPRQRYRVVGRRNRRTARTDEEGDGFYVPTVAPR